MKTLAFHASDGVRLAYCIDGPRNGKHPLLLLNGLFGDMPFWDPVVEAISSDRLCIRMDHRGIGQSERWIGNYSYELYAQDVLQLLDLLEIPKVHLIGFCHGGMVGAVLARDFPQRLSSFTLQGARLVASEKMRLYEQLRRDVLVRDGVVAMSWMQTCQIFGERFLRENAPWLRAMAEASIKRMNVESAIPMVDALMNFDLTPQELRSMSVPALFLAGEEDSYAAPWLVKRGANLWPGAQFSVLPECGHVVLRESLNLFLTLVRRFIHAHE
ncbi:MAG TPA: alpha/beta hydrolase [Fibrobacteraceae bacterium]|nr:alpha/beta hydrolase [Fibrobacteraceae bacterium]